MIRNLFVTHAGLAVNSQLSIALQVCKLKHTSSKEKEEEGPRSMRPIPPIHHASEFVL